jgi:coronin-1B/1C/6
MPTPQKSFNMMHKSCLDANKHEINRGVRMGNNGTLDYLSFVMPNRTGQFQDDLYPEFQSTEPSSNYDEWASGIDKPANHIALRPQASAESGQKKASFAAKLAGKPVSAAVSTPPVKSNNDDELIALRAEIDRLKSA